MNLLQYNSFLTVDNKREIWNYNWAIEQDDIVSV